MRGVETAQQEHLDLAARLVAMTDKAGGHDTRVIENQRISRLQILLEVIKVSMLDGLLHRIEYHQPRSITRFNRNLCDAFFW